MIASAVLIHKLDDLDPKVRDAFIAFHEELESRMNVVTVGRADFEELKGIVRNLAEAQGRTEQRIEALTQAQERTEQRLESLAQAQERTEQRLGSLAQAQERTEQRLEALAQAQERTEQRLGSLAQAQERTEQRLEALAQAQERTEQRLEALAQAQERTEQRLGSLAQAQERTEQRLEALTQAQERTEQRLEGLAQAQEKLTQAQTLTEQRLDRLAQAQEKLAQAQERTEASVKVLAEGQKDMRKQLGGLAMAVGYGIEDRLMPHIKAFALRELGIEVRLVDRRNVMYADGNYDEVNVFAEGVRNGTPCFLVGECKAQPAKKDFDRFHKMVERLRAFLPGEVVPFLVGYQFSPQVEQYADARYPTLLRYKTFNIAMAD